MGCQYFAPTDHGADSFTVAMPRLTVGRGTLREAGERAVALGMSRVALFTDPGLASGPLVAIVGALSLMMPRSSVATPSCRMAGLTA